MKINIIGGGPAGTYFRNLIKKGGAAPPYTLVRRQRAEGTVGVRRGGGGGQRAHSPPARCDGRTIEAEHRSAPEFLLVDGLHAAIRCIHILLPRDRARHFHCALLSIRAATLDLDHRDRPANLCA